MSYLRLIVKVLRIEQTEAPFHDQPAERYGQPIEWCPSCGGRRANPGRVCGYREDSLEPAFEPTERLLAQYFVVRLEAEKRAMLDSIRAAQTCEP